MTLTYLIMGITAAISYYASTKPLVLDKMLFKPQRVAVYKEYYRFISSGFIHIGLMHFLFNMITLYFFGLWLESYFVAFFGVMGYVYWLIAYFGGMAVAHIPTYLQHKKSHHYSSLGASGAVSAIIFGCILYNPIQNMCLYGFLCIPGFILGVVYLIYSYIYAKNGSADNINHSAHLFGAIFGFLFAIVVQPIALLQFFDAILSWRLF